MFKSSLGCRLGYLYFQDDINGYFASLQVSPTMAATVAYPEVGHELADYWAEYDLARHHNFYEEPQHYEGNLHYM